jgi:glutathione S-transferase
MKLKIHAFPPSPRSFKVLAVANHLGIEYELHICDLTRGEQRRPEFGAINPNHKLPALEDDGLRLWESNAIIQYLASLKPESELAPTDERARADVARWMFWEATTWDPAGATIAFERGVKAILGLGAPDPAEVEKGLQAFNAAAAILDAHLNGRTFVCGDRLTLADFAIGSMLTLTQMVQLPVESYAEIGRWSARLQALPAWQTALAQQKQTAAAAA